MADNRDRDTAIILAGLFILLLILITQPTSAKPNVIVAPVAAAVNTGIIHGAMVDENGHETASGAMISGFNSLAGKKLGVVYFSDRQTGVEPMVLTVS